MFGMSRYDFRNDALSVSNTSGLKRLRNLFQLTQTLSVKISSKTKFFRDRNNRMNTITSDKRGYMLETPSILYAERYEVGTISREDFTLCVMNPQRLHATHPELVEG